MLLDKSVNLNNRPFFTLKSNFHNTFSPRNENGDFIFDLNQSNDTIKRKLKQYFE